MKRIAIFSMCILCIAIATTAFIPDNCFQQHWGTKKLYQPSDTANTAIPAGYEPVFINYIGRHGTRHLTNLNELLQIRQTLKDADTMDALTAEGSKLKKMIDDLLLIEKKEYAGLLTEAGKQEQEGIGRRMKAHYPMLFNKATTYIQIVDTKEKRTKQSAAAFMQGIGRTMQPGVYTQVNDNDSVHLRFFEICPGYKNFKKKGSWIPEMKKLERSEQVKQETAKIVHEFFKDEYAAHLLSQQGDTGTNKKLLATDFIDGLFNITTLPTALRAEIIAAGYKPEQLNIRALFTCDELAWLEFINSAQDFLQKGPGTDVNGIQVRNAVPLLVDFIKTTDSFMQNDKPAAIARFAHAETLSPFASLLEINGAATQASDIFSYDKVWDVSNIIGFSANVQWVFYKSKGKKKDVLVKILYNEKPTKIPVTTKFYPYYLWADVRQFYINKLKRLDISLDSDMLEYLQQLK